MIVKIIKKSQGFQGVQYNTNKIELDKGELMLVRNFQALQGIGLLKPRDYVNYLKAVANRNQLIKSPQFHAVISCKEKEKNKYELTALAQKWLERMGYGENPYMLIFHKDTKNNHIHIVSSRVNKQAKLIDTGFTYIRAIKMLNQLTGHDEQLSAENDLELALAYQFSSMEQFVLILRSLGYSSAVKSGNITLFKFGRKMIDTSIAIVEKRIALFSADQDRAHAIKATIEAQKNTTNQDIHKNSSFHKLPAQIRVFTSKLTEELHQRSGLQFFFHAEPGKMPSEFTIVDHEAGRVFSGVEIMSFDALIASGKAMRIDQTRIFPEQFTQASGAFFQISIADDVDDEAVFGRKRHGKRDQSQQLSR